MTESWTREGDALENACATCGTCLYWSREPRRHGYAECRRHAPRLIAEGVRDWAVTHEDEGCGEYRAEDYRQPTADHAATAARR